MYFQGGGIIPRRKNNVASGAYPKIGKNPDNKWQGRIPLDEMPFLINPQSGYIVSTNNFVTSPNVKHGVSHAFTFTGRQTAISEMIEELFEKTENKVSHYHMAKMQTDVLDVQAKASTPDMLYCVE